MNLNSLLLRCRLAFKFRSQCLPIFISILISPSLYAEKPEFQDLPGWHNDDLSNAWNSWQQSCIAFERQKLDKWIQVCNKSVHIDITDTQNIREFFEQNFKVEPISTADNNTIGIITGYYEPILTGSNAPDDRFRYPIYTKPDSVSAQSASRREISENPDILAQYIIAWTDNPYDLFFLHVQGSGLIEFEDGRQMSLVYAGNNDHDYTSIGKVLINNGAIAPEAMSMQRLKQWLADNPDQAGEIMHKNQRFIYFNLTDKPAHETGPRGSLNVPLTPRRSIAVDPKQVMLGSPVWIDTTLPSAGQSRQFQQLVFAQDTGAAIKGRVRADVFFGQGKQAEFLAGNMNQSGKMYLLTPL